MSAEQLGRLIARAGDVVAFTGAGVSTESGIPDFRSPGGVWTRYDPREFTFQRYVESKDTRVRSWRMRLEMWQSRPQPNAAHRALAALEAAGVLRAVITQNIDGLHQDAGSRRVVEIHGSSRRVSCIGAAPRAGTPEGCGFDAPHEWVFDLLEQGVDDPGCPDCGGLLKTATVSFGQQLSPGVLDEAAEVAARAGVLLTVGSSLQVYPAAGLPAAAKDAGALVAIVNNEPTPFDAYADLVVRGAAGDVLAAAARIVIQGGPEQ